jgi:hypothetical protein
MISFTLPEIRRLLVHLAIQHTHAVEHIWHWSRWRRQRQYQARLSHYRRRGFQLA